MMAKLLPIQRGALRAIAKTLVVALALLLQSLAFLAVDGRSASAHRSSSLALSEPAICRAIAPGDAPAQTHPLGPHDCDLCPFGGCEVEATSFAALASHPAVAKAPRSAYALASRRPAEALSSPAGRARHFSPRAPPLA
jgi:hypothetical protein